MTEQVDLRKKNIGRPKKLTVRDEKKVIRALQALRKERASFTANKIEQEREFIMYQTGQFAGV